jgi:branched-chain amino acid transport system ATP-binding protein
MTVADRTVDQEAAPALRLTDVDVRFGPIHALQRVSLDVPRGRVTTLIGLNGAGKSTILKAITGLVRVQSGRIETGAGEDLLRWPAHGRGARFGLAYVPEGRGLFARMTTRDNLRFGSAAAARRRGHRGAAPTLPDVLEIFPRIRDRLDSVAGNLSGGEQQMVSIARALLAGGDILLLDEPSIGLAPVVIEDIVSRLLNYVAQHGLTILLVEQKTDLALKIADHVHILDSGVLRLSGTPEEVAGNRDITDMYFGRQT